MVRPLLLAITLALLSSTANAQAQADPVASASVVTGRVQVNQGEKFLPMRPGQQLKAGDRVMAMDDSQATISFADGCTLVVEEQTIVTVPATSTCAGGIANVQGIAPAGSSAVGCPPQAVLTGPASGPSLRLQALAWPSFTAKMTATPSAPEGTAIDRLWAAVCGPSFFG